MYVCMYINNIFIVYERLRLGGVLEVCGTLGKLIGLLFLFCLPLLSILFLKTKRNDLARPVMGTIFHVGRAKRYPHWGVQSRFHVIYIYTSKEKSI